MRTPLPLTLCAAALVAVLLGLASPAAGQEPPDGRPQLMAGDYGIENVRWNGLSDFVGLANSLGHPVRPGSGLDLSKLQPNDRVIVVYPTRDLDRKALASFVIDGGKVLLVDDFGASDSFLERLGISRVPMRRMNHTEHYLGRPGLPIFRPKGKHALLEGVDEVVANHPAALTTQGGAILPYDQDEHGLVYDMRLARGKVIVVGDASLLINHMLRVADNRKFVGNTINYLCDGVPDCRPYLLVGEFELTGTYHSVNEPDDSVSDAVTEAIDWMNEGLSRLKDYDPPRNAIYFASLILMFGLIIFLATILPMRRTARIVPRVGPPAHVKPLSEFEWNVQRYAFSGQQANYALPIAILKSDFERAFLSRVAHGEKVPPTGDPGRPAFLRRMAQRYVERHLADQPAHRQAAAYKSTARLLELFARLPSRDRLFLDSELTFTERDLLRIWTQCHAILTTLGVEEDHD